MSKPKPPTPPDPRETAAAQTGSAISTAAANQSMNMVNQITPDGSLTYNQSGTQQITDPSTGRTYNVPMYTATTELSDSAQELSDLNRQGQLGMANLANSQIGRLDDVLGAPMDLSTLPAMADRGSAQTPQFGDSLTAPQYQTGGVSAPEFRGDLQAAQTGGDISTPELQSSYIDDFSADRQRVEDALFERMNPQMEQDQRRLENQLANQGITRGSAAWDRAMENRSQSVNDARLATILGAGQEQSRLAGLSRDQALFGNQAAQQGFANERELQSRADTLGQQAYQNAAGQQSRADQLAQQGFGNEFMLQDYANQMGAQGFADQQAIQGRDDALAQQQFGNQQALLDAQDRQRQMALEEGLTLRNQPINEIMALASGTQVQNPQFTNTPGVNIPTTDYAGLVQQNFANQQADYQQRMNARNQLYGGLFGLGSSAILGRGV